MKNWVKLLLFVFVLLIFIISYKIKLVERFISYYKQFPNGKNWQNEVGKQKQMYVSRMDLVFIGDSHIEQCEWHEFFPALKIGNRGIGGETSGALLSRLETAVLPGTSMVVIQIGVNDILSGIKTDQVLENYKNIISRFQKIGCRILPTLPFLTRYYPEKNVDIYNLNNALISLFDQHKIQYINLNDVLSNNGALRLEYTSDGVHLNSAGYLEWIYQLRKIIRVN